MQKLNAEQIHIVNKSDIQTVDSEQIRNNIGKQKAETQMLNATAAEIHKPKETLEDQQIACSRLLNEVIHIFIENKEVQKFTATRDIIASSQHSRGINTILYCEWKLRVTYWLIKNRVQ